MRYFIQLSYMGTNYHGWQFQPNGMSIQEKLETALSTILQVKTAVVGAGRTDAGVHAKNYIAHFEMESSEYSSDLAQFVYKLNTLLPYDIAVHQVYEVAPEMHARFDAKSRTYQYYISTSKDPFNHHSSWLRLGKLDVEKMNQACKILLEYTDFTSFAKLHTDTKTNNCQVKHAHWSEKDGLLCFEITADRFLRNMVRAIVGTMVEIGVGKIEVQQLHTIIKSKDRSKAGISVPAKGLFLVDICY